MISHEHRAVFVHVPKAAGTSIEAAFGHHGPAGVMRDVQDHRTLRQLLWPHTAAGVWRSRENVEEALHAVKARVRPPAHPPNRRRLTRQQYREYLTFTVVRNPWARVHSWYRNVVTDAEHRQRLGIRAEETLAEVLPRQLGHDMLRPQLYWLVDFRGRVGVEVVCRYEHLAEDFAGVARRVGLPEGALPHLNRGRGGGAYVDAYDDATRRLVAEYYRAEIEQFGYRFGA